MTFTASFTWLGLLESTLILALLGGWFLWRLQPTAWLQAQRFTLLLLPGLAFILPLVQWSVVLPVPTGAWPSLERDLPQHLVFVFAPTTSTTLTWGKALLAVYWLGFVVSLLQSCVALFKVMQLILQGKRQDHGPWTAVVHPRLWQPASFFHFVFLPNLAAIDRLVLAHELVHVRQRHSWDLLLMELWVAFFWFHPLIYRLRRALRATHEFIADATVVAQENSAYSYAQLLLHYHQKNVPMPVHAFANGITQRLERLINPRSKRSSWREFACLLPLIGLLGGLFSVKWAQALPQSSPVSRWLDQVGNLEQQPLIILEQPTLEPVALDPQEVLENLTHAAEPQLHNVQEPQLKLAEVNHLSRRNLDTLPAPQERPLGFTTRPSTVNTQPLVVIDGEVHGFGINLNEIDPNDIERIDVYKGTRAVELYGTAGRHGVIEVTTRHGKKRRKALAAQPKPLPSPARESDWGHIDTLIVVPTLPAPTHQGGEPGLFNLDERLGTLMRQGLLVVNNQVLGPISEYQTEQFEAAIKSLDAQATFTINLDNAATEKFYGAAARHGVVVVRCSGEALRKIKALRKP